MSESTLHRQRVQVVAEDERINPTTPVLCLYYTQTPKTLIRSEEKQVLKVKNANTSREYRLDQDGSTNVAVRVRVLLLYESTFVLSYFQKVLLNMISKLIGITFVLSYKVRKYFRTVLLPYYLRKKVQQNAYDTRSYIL